MRSSFDVLQNIIIFIGDGMSLPTVAAARIYKGQQEKNAAQANPGGLAEEDGNSAKLSWENFPNVGLSMVTFLQTTLCDSVSIIFVLDL